MNIRRSFLALAAMILGVGFLGASAAQANHISAPAFGTKSETFGGVTCKTWFMNEPTHSYPADDTHYWVCGMTTANASRINRIPMTVRRIGTFLTSRPTFIKDHNVKYYFFRNRAEATAFANGKFGILAGALNNTTARCGVTAKLAVSGDIYSFIYDTCSYVPTPPLTAQNPDLNKVTAHETGHAFDFAVGKDNGNPGPSQTAGFRALANGDISVLTPANWSTMTATQKQSYVCGVFGSLLPSDLEKDLAVPSNQVCQGGNLQAPYVGKTPTEIARIRAPYFVLGGSATGTSPAFSDLFVELFSIQAGYPNSNNLLNMTDTLLKANMANPSSNNRQFNCTRQVLKFWVTQHRPPTPAELTAVACPSNPGPLQ